MTNSMCSAIATPKQIRFPPVTNNRILAQTTTSAQTWWQYNVNGEVTWIGKTPCGNEIEPAWDALDLLRGVSENCKPRNPDTQNWSIK